MAAVPRASSPPASWTLARCVAFALLFAVCYFAAQLCSNLLRYPTTRVTPMWIPLGLIVGVMIAAPRRLWPWVIAGAFAGQFISYPTLNYPFWFLVAIVILAVLPAAFTAYLVQRVNGPQLLSRRRLLMLAAAGIPAVWVLLVLPISALIAVVRPDLGFNKLLFWNTGSGMAVILLVTPAAAAAADALLKRRPIPTARLAEATTRWLLLLAAAAGAFWFNNGAGHLQALQFLPLPILLWSALRFQVIGVAIDLFTLALVAFIAAAQGQGPLGSMASDGRMFLMQITLSALGLPMLFLAAVVAERAAAETRAATQLRFEELIARISSALTGAQPSTVESLLTQALSDIGAFLDADRVILAETDAHSGDLVGRWHSRRTEPPIPDRLLISARYPWIWRELRAGRSINIPDVALLPAEAAPDLEHFREVGIRSQIAVPVMRDGRLEYVLAVANLGRTLPADIQPRLRVLAEVLATAVQRCAAEEVLRQTQYAVDHNPALIFRIDLSGGFTYANEAARSQLGYSRMELQRLHIWEVGSTTSSDRWPLRVAEIREQGATQFESVFSRHDRTTFPVEVRTIYLRDPAGDFFFSFAFDISARKAAQEAAHQHLHRIQGLATEMARAEERQRRELAAILHDEVGQNLFAATTQLLALKTATAAPAAPAGAPLPQTVIDKVLALLDQVTRDTRELTFELCPPVLYELGLRPALQRLLEQFSSRYGIATTLEGDGRGPADLNIRGLAYHSVRELLNNVAKHAHASHVTVQIDDEAAATGIEVIDDGRGCDEELLRSGKGGFGLFNLRERAELLGGGLTVSTAPGHGCRVQLTLPLEAAQEGP